MNHLMDTSTIEKYAGDQHRDTYRYELQNSQLIFIAFD